MSTNTQPRNINTGAHIIARASLSILKDTRPVYSRSDRHDLDVLKEYGY